MPVRNLFRYGTLLAITGLGLYLLAPPEESASTADRPVARSGEAAQEPRFTIKIAPGQSYMPGVVPSGIGEPLRGLTTVIDRFEARFPDTHIEVLNVPAVREYLVTQLSSGSAPDIVNANVEDVWIDVHKDWYVPLDSFLEAPNPFVLERNDPQLPGARQWWDMFRYQAISRGKAAPNGKSYCLSLDMVETGIFYNKTLFAELGLQPPQDWEAFLVLLQNLRDAGKIPLLMSIGAFNDWCHDLVFDQLYHDLLPGIDLKQDASREGYLQGYLDPEEIAFLYREKDFFTRKDPRYRELWQHLRRLRDFTNSDLNSTDLTREFVNQQGAMLWSGSWLTYRLSADKGLGFDWGVFYLPPFTRTTSAYASPTPTPMCVIGGVASQFEVTNSAVADTDPDLPFAERMKNSQRLQRVIAFLQFLSLPENAETVINEYSCLIPNIVGVEPLPPLAPFVEILERRYTTTKWAYTFDLRFNDVMTRMLQMYLTDGVDLDEFLDWQERNLRAATTNFVSRKQLDLDGLEAAWQQRAAVRATMVDLPPTR